MAPAPGHDAYADAAIAYCFRSQRCVRTSKLTKHKTQSVNRRLRSGESGSPLTRKFNRSQSSSPGHLPVHTSRRGSSPWKYAQPSVAQPQCGQRSTSHPLLWRWPIAAPQSAQGPGFVIRFLSLGQLAVADDNSQAPGVEIGDVGARKCPRAPKASFRGDHSSPECEPWD
jgi:hypothetical protein